MVEFLATISFRRKIGALEDGNLTFCLRGETRDLSLAKFAMRTEIYLQSEVHTESNLEFITGCIFKDDTYWPTIANETIQQGDCTRERYSVTSPSPHAQVNHEYHKSKERGGQGPDVGCVFLMGPHHTRYQCGHPISCGEIPISLGGKGSPWFSSIWRDVNHLDCTIFWHP